MNSSNSTSLRWQDPPNIRGTFDILKTCTGTIFLLCFTSVCPNIPSPDGGFWAGFRMKICLFLLAILGPEFILVLALGELNAAWNAKKAFRKAGHKWDLRQCFFVNMGGLHLRFRDREAERKSTFPVDCQQLLLLQQRGLMDVPELALDVIESRNKADGLARLIAVVQALWFTADAFGRLAQNLFLTTLELTTLAFVFLMVACSACWWRKPMDISKPITIDVDRDLSTLLQSLHAPTPLRGRTPFSFLTHDECFMRLFWAFYAQILRDLRLMPSRWQPKPTEADHFPAIDFRPLDLSWELIGAPFIILYGSIFMGPWNSPFPTMTEHLLWRAASIMCLFYCCVGELVAAIHHYQIFIRRVLAGALSRISRLLQSRKSNRNATTSTLPLVQASSNVVPTLARNIRNTESWNMNWFEYTVNNSPDKDPALAIPLGWWIITTCLCVAYFLSRLFILVEDVVGLRSLPASAYRTVNYGPYSPIL